MVHEGVLLGTLSTNRIAWDADTTSLPSWDDVAGATCTYHDTYQPDGNALVLMSMNINPDARGRRIPNVLIGCIKALGQASGVEHIIGSFRPNQFGQHKKHWADTSFEVYIGLHNQNGQPLDGWLRSLSHHGMTPLKVDHSAMQVPVSRAEFEAFRQPDWQEVRSNVWECGEVGSWYVSPDGQSATYRESNVW